MFKMKFSKCGCASQANHTLRYVGEKIKFQNSFGAWNYMIYTCDYDPAAKRVLEVKAGPRGS